MRSVRAIVRRPTRRDASGRLGREYPWPMTVVGHWRRSMLGAGGVALLLPLGLVLGVALTTALGGSQTLRALGQVFAGPRAAGAGAAVSDIEKTSRQVPQVPARRHSAAATGAAAASSGAGASTSRSGSGSSCGGGGGTSSGGGSGGGGTGGSGGSTGGSGSGGGSGGSG